MLTHEPEHLESGARQPHLVGVELLHQVAPALEQPLATGDGLFQPQPDPGGVMRMDRDIRARRFGQLTDLEALADGKWKSRLPEEPTAELDRLIIELRFPSAVRRPVLCFEFCRLVSARSALFLVRRRGRVTPTSVDYDYAGKQPIPAAGLTPARHTALWAASGTTRQIENRRNNRCQFILLPKNELTPITTRRRPASVGTREPPGKKVSSRSRVSGRGDSPAPSHFQSVRHGRGHRLHRLSIPGATRPDSGTGSIPAQLRSPPKRIRLGHPSRCGRGFGLQAVDKRQ
jgi:hypothetical protein